MGEDLAHFLRSVHEEVDKIARRTGEARAKLFALGRNTNGAVVGVANTSHDAASGNHRNGTETVLVGTHESGLDDVKTGAAATVGAQDDALPKAVLNESSVRFDETHLQRTTAVLDGRQRRRAGTTIATRNLDDVGVRLGDAGRDRADARLGHELHGHLRVLVDHVQVIDELREILNGVDVVVRRRGDEWNTSLGSAEPGNVRGNLLTRKLTTFTRLGTLRHLDFGLVGRHQERRRDTKATGSDLLDSGRRDVAILACLEGTGMFQTCHPRWRQ